MRPPLWDELGITIPVFAFSHCRDVVAAVTNAGGVGVYGAAMASTSQIDQDLAWIERETRGRAYGVDLLMPARYVGDESGHLDAERGATLVPEEHRRFLDELMRRHDVPAGNGSARVADGPAVPGGTRYTAEEADEALDVVFRYRPKLLVSALGTPPAHVMARARDRGMLVGALAGKAAHAIAHQRAGVDLVIAQSYEAGGHTGEIGGLVLVPEVVDAVHPMPVLMAGGIGRGRQLAAALALGAEGVWCGSLWLTTVESEVPPLLKSKLLAASSGDTVRTRAFTGKPARFLRTPWSEAWDSPENPDPLPTPVHSRAIESYWRRIEHAADAPGARPDQGAGLLVSKPVGQVIGLLNKATSCRQVISELMEDCVAATARLTERLEEAGG
ncbi:MAG TPA: nitronate monooxygenase family protein [Pseudonocardia sp.]|jgi:NAD(P)H-dependent flavin oxidoreductase YrpB (nitropropane dioxygenase family)